MFRCPLVDAIRIGDTGRTIALMNAYAFEIGVFWVVCVADTDKAFRATVTAWLGIRNIIVDRKAFNAIAAPREK